MSNFPLYDSLNKKIPSGDLSSKKKKEFIANIKIIDETGRDLIYALIQFYYLQNEDTFEDIPYKGVRKNVVKGKGNLTWNLANFPLKLRHILYKFVLIHIKKMEEERIHRDQII